MKGYASRKRARQPEEKECRYFVLPCGRALVIGPDGKQTIVSSPEEAKAVGCPQAWVMAEIIMGRPED